MRWARGGGRSVHPFVFLFGAAMNGGSPAQATTRAGLQARKLRIPPRIISFFLTGSRTFPGSADELMRPPLRKPVLAAAISSLRLASVLRELPAMGEPLPLRLFELWSVLKLPVLFEIVVFELSAVATVLALLTLAASSRG